ncbi:hypothetical protein HG530_003696 [Fusarium avenaceum]|nr:hypothetical protein HG530_003696 [Fusarium avenaceum]
MLTLALADHVVLAVVLTNANLIVVVEEAVKTTTKDEDILGVHSANTPGAGTPLRGTSTGSLEVRVVELLVDSEGNGRVGVALHVVVVKNAVLGSSAPQPGALGALNQDTTTVVEVDLRVVAKVKLVISNPEPGVLEVDAGLLGHVEKHESTHTLSLGLSLNRGGLLASIGLELSTSRATDAEVNVKEAGRARGLASDVELHQDSTGLGSESLKHEVLDLDIADITSLTDLPDGLGVGLILEVLAATSHDERPDFADNLDVLGNLDSIGNDIGTVVEVNNLALLNTVKDSLDSSSVVGLSITLGTLGLDRNKVGGGNGVVLRLALGDDVAVAGEDSLGLRDGSLRALNSLAATASVSTTLDPRVDLGVASKDGCAGTSVLDSDRDSRRHVDVVEDQSTVGAGLAGVVVGKETNLGVGNLAVSQEDGADVLDAPASGHVNSNLGTGDVEAVEGPDPVPVHVDGSVTVAEGHVAASELLAAKEATIASTDEGEVGHETTRAVVDEDTLLLVVLARVLDHLEDDVLERSGLGNLPVDTGSRTLGHTSKVNLEVTDLAEEVVLVGVPVGTVGVVGIGIDDSHTLEVGRRLENGKLTEITNHVGVVVGENRLGDNVGTRREVNNSRGNSGRVAALAATVAIRKGGVDGRSVVRAAITLGAVILDVTEDLVVASTAIGNGTLALDRREPPRPSSSRSHSRSGVLRNRRSSNLDFDSLRSSLNR